MRREPTRTRRGFTLIELLESERRAIRDYALRHPEVRHRESAWKMLDENVCAVSSSSVYRVLREADLVCRWKPKAKVTGQPRQAPAKVRPDIQIDEHELEDVTEAKAVIAAIIDHYNHHRLHAALSYLRPVDYYRGDPAASVSL